MLWDWNPTSESLKKNEARDKIRRRCRTRRVRGNDGRTRSEHPEMDVTMRE
jgi:hypothetical protein